MTRKPNKYELRFAEGEGFQADETGIVEGYAVVYGKPANIGGAFTEYIERGALDGCDLRDVQFLINHNGQGITLARSRNNNENSTMQLTPDDVGLHMRAKLDIENNPEARALHSAIMRGDVSGMSFRFIAEKDRWEGLRSNNPVRHIEKIRYIREISAVNTPAYPDTSIVARSADAESTLESARAALDSAKNDALELAKAKNEIYFI